MKHLFKLLFLMCFLGCKFQIIKKDIEKPLFKNFNFEEYGNEYKNYKKAKTTGNPIFNNLEFYSSPSQYTGIYIYIYPQKKQFYTIANEYYDLENNTNIKRLGKTFGWDMFLQTEMKIGWWYEYDESGKIIKKTDEDTKFGVFGYNELLKSLDNNKIINLKKGVEYVDGGKWNIRIQFFYTPNSTKKLWKVTLQTEDVADRTVFGKDFIKVYYFDGNTGERILKMIDKVDYYKEIGFHL
ncbi:hypothetical protein V3470_05780 [Flavobacterium oreochromis]|uniref:hypothetical protein n=1 Tax=Flavobacterium oreochromis TaxID=2906078 RepID=UPI0013F673E6